MHFATLSLLSPYVIDELTSGVESAQWPRNDCQSRDNASDCTTLDIIPGLERAFARKNFKRIQYVKGMFTIECLAIGSSPCVTGSVQAI